MMTPNTLHSNAVTTMLIYYCYYIIIIIIINLQKLFENQFTVTDLEPFSEYVFEVEARNSFTATDTKYKFGSEKELMTAEGG